MSIRKTSFVLTIQSHLKWVKFPVPLPLLPLKPTHQPNNVQLSKFCCFSISFDFSWINFDWVWKKKKHFRRNFVRRPKNRYRRKINCLAFNRATKAKQQQSIVSIEWLSFPSVRSHTGKKNWAEKRPFWFLQRPINWNVSS